MAVEPEQKDPPLVRAYRVIIIEPFESSDEITSTYPEAIRQCHEATIKALENLHAYDHVSDVAQPDLPLQETLKVKSRVTDMRQIQMWRYRRYAGSSYMQIDIELVDGETGATVREKKIESYNNPWVAKWSDSDATLPIDVAGILAGYIHSVIPR
jgi:hypothetical protein